MFSAGMKWIKTPYETKKIILLIFKFYHGDLSVINLELAKAASSGSLDHATILNETYI